MIRNTEKAKHGASNLSNHAKVEMPSTSRPAESKNDFLPWSEFAALTLLIFTAGFVIWARLNNFEDWDHLTKWAMGLRNMDNQIIVDSRRWTVQLTPQDIAEHRFTDETLKRMEAALADTGLVHVTGGSIWTDRQLDELDDLTYGELELAKAAAANRGLRRPPWSLNEWWSDFEENVNHEYKTKKNELQSSDLCSDCAAHVKRKMIEKIIEVDPDINPLGNFSYGDAVSISYGRIDMPHFLNYTLFQRPPYYNRSDLNQLCRSYSPGALCETTLAGALWNFPGSDTYLWHQDAAQEGFYDGQDEVTGTLTTAIASRTLPTDVGWIYFQPLTHDRGEYASIDKSEHPEAGQPEGVSIPLKRGEMLIFTDTTKHTVTPNPTDIDRGIVYILYGSQSWEDTPWHGTGTLISPEVRAKDPRWSGPIRSRKDIK